MTTISITERIKTYEDACACQNVVENFENLTKDEIAYRKLKTIAKALNEGWLPNFTPGEWRYFPWFRLYTNEEIDRMSEADKALVVRRSSYSSNTNGGVAFAGANVAASSTHAAFGSRLALKNHGLAVYFGRQFVDIWVDFIFVHGDEN